MRSRSSISPRGVWTGRTWISQVDEIGVAGDEHVGPRHPGKGHQAVVVGIRGVPHLRWRVVDHCGVCAEELEVGVCLI